MIYSITNLVCSSCSCWEVSDRCVWPFPGEQDDILDDKFVKQGEAKVLEDQATAARGVGAAPPKPPPVPVKFPGAGLPAGAGLPSGKHRAYTLTLTARNYFATLAGMCIDLALRLVSTGLAAAAKVGNVAAPPSGNKVQKPKAWQTAGDKFKAEREKMKAGLASATKGGS